MNIFGLILWIVFVCLVLWNGLAGTREIELMKNTVNTNPRVRIDYYLKSYKKSYISTIVILLIAVFGLGMNWKDFGISMPALNTSQFGSLSLIVLIILGIYTFSTLFTYITCKMNSHKYNFSNTTPMEDNDSYLIILPMNREEEKHWNFISFTAGFTEELVFRAFLMYLISFTFPSLSIVVVAVISASIFGIAHYYQGMKGIWDTFLFGLLHSFSFVIIGSIIPLIIIHWLVDNIAKYSKFFGFQMEAIEG